MQQHQMAYAYEMVQQCWDSRILEMFAPHIVINIIEVDRMLNFPRHMDSLV